ncbi:MAG: alpha-L-fucosidase [Bacteroidaceae bacterium]|nr:alpha-L-fucosidase [Bacteroidaceae bacterium]
MRLLHSLLFLFLSTLIASAQYLPTEANLQARRDFESCRFGIFLHWGIYSTFAQGEWYLNNGLTHEEYSKAASAFYPIRFDAKAWAEAIKASGARYVTFTSRHHDGFSMFRTRTSTYNICDATPFQRDVLHELAEACQEQGLRLHLYYSILDWMRQDYPLGRTGKKTRNTLQPNYDTYFDFMKTQVTELLTNYQNVSGLWFDGYWDHDADSIPFDWRMPEFYRFIHQLRPSCLIGNNHHITPIEGEDFQMFERDLPGENTAGLSGQEISHLPLEMCQTMNGMWGYKVADQNYKSTEELIQLIARAAAKSSNLLLNIGPQPNGELPATALDRLKGIGRWMQANGESIYGTTSTALGEQPWGVTTQKEGCLFLHLFASDTDSVNIPWTGKKPKTVRTLATGTPLPYTFNKKTKSLIISLPSDRDKADFVIEVQTGSN